MFIIIMLTCDAGGVMPPSARLTPNQVLYQFISGYKARIAGTEVGLGAEPEITFSACFGGPYGVGKRTSVCHARNLLNAALMGKLAKVEYYRDPVFGFEVPQTCPEVPNSVLEPWSSWPSRAEYDKRYQDLASRFAQNFAKFCQGAPQDVIEAGPKV